MNWTKLIKNRYDSDTLVHGTYFIIKFTPDFVANEVLNIGVAFIDVQDNIHFKLLSNLQGFECLYGKKSVEVVSLLFESVKTALQDTGYVSSPSPHIKYSPLIPTSGLSITTILDSLYQDYIHLDHYEEPDKQPKTQTLSTDDMRKVMFSYFKKTNATIYDAYMCADKVVLKSDLNAEVSIELDLPIWHKNSNPLFEQSPLFATVVSADYVNPAHLSLNLDYLGSTTIRNACELQGKKSKAGLFIYRPAISERISKDELTNIDNHIHNTLFSLQRMKANGYSIDIEVVDDIVGIFRKVEQFVC